MAMVLFVCIAVVSVRPGIVDDLGLSAPARGVEFFLFCSMLLLNGLVTAWLMLFSETPAAGGGVEGPSPGSG